MDDPAAPPRCRAVRETVSARLDGEAGSLPGADVGAHLDRCAGCSGFAAALPTVSRRVRVAAAEPVPDLTGPLLAALAADRNATRDRRGRDLRVLVGLAGVVQLLLALPVLLGAAAPALHVGRDLGAFELALGAGLLLAALQPARAAGVLPVAAVVAVVATVGGTVDLAAGRATVLTELTHLTELVGVAALWAWTRRLPDVPPTVAAGAVEPDAV